MFNIELPQDPALHLTELKTCLYKNVNMTVRAALLITAKNEINPNVQCLDDQVNKMWWIYKGYYLAITTSEVLIHATTWMNPENIILTEKSQF